MFFSQTDPRWANYIYSAVLPHNETIYSSGCGLCCACNIISNLTDTFIFPPALADYSVQNGYRADGKGTSWGLYESIAKKYSLELQQTTSLNIAIECVKNGGMVICSTSGGARGLFSTGGHLFTMVGIDGDIIKFFDSYIYVGKYTTSYRKNKATYKDDFVYVDKKYVSSEIQQYFCFKNNNIRKEDEQMEQKYIEKIDEIQKQVAVLNENIKECDWTTACPAWSIPTIQKLLDKGYLKGDEKGELNLKMSDIRILVINDRAGIYN
jgi:signal peptidase I